MSLLSVKDNKEGADMYTVNAPAHFPGTRKEVAANRSTHSFSWDEEGRCLNCDCRSWGIVAEWPCGADVPRVVLVDGKEVAHAVR